MNSKTILWVMCQIIALYYVYEYFKFLISSSYGLWNTCVCVYICGKIIEMFTWWIEISGPSTASRGRMALFWVRTPTIFVKFWSLFLKQSLIGNRVLLCKLKKTFFKNLNFVEGWAINFMYENLIFKPKA